MESAKLIFLDEAGVNIAMSNNYGWAPPGEAPVIERPMRGEHVTLIGAIAEDGPVALRRVEGTVDGEKLLSFLREDLGPKLKEGDVVVMDGPRLHRIAGVAEVLGGFGAAVRYLPAYSPEFNPIEMTWSWLKRRMRKEAPRKIRILREVVDRIWNCLTPDLCAAWVRHAGYGINST